MDDGPLVPGPNRTQDADGRLLQGSWLMPPFWIHKRTEPELPE